ncbi:hypothetical protein GMSM_21500 [Geomonas sp. Red276]
MSWKKILWSKGSRREVIASLSVANLWLVRLWLKILPYHRGSGFFLAASPLNSYLAAMANVLLVGGLLYLLIRLVKGERRLFPWLVLAVICATTVIVAYGIGVAFISFARFVFLFGVRGAFWFSVACWGGGALLLGLLVRYRGWLARHYTVLPLLFSPYLLITFGESLQAVYLVEPSAHFRPHAIDPSRPLVNPLKRRVVWVIFDETDYRLAFAKRPASLSLPAFDRLKREAFFATRAYSPNDNTQTSLPSLITGIPLVRTVPQGAASLELERQGGLPPCDFAAQESVFSEVKRRGGSTALLGWYIPYARTMKGVDFCRDYPRFNFYTSESFLDVLVHQWREVVDFRFLPGSSTMLADNQIGMVTSMGRDVAAAIRTQDPTLTFLHFSVPHSPNVYDRTSGRLAFNRNKREGYLDNLALADRCLGELRRSLEEKGIWDSTLLVVSSDHHWRTNTYDQVLDRQHVPYLVKLPGERAGFTYGGRFNTILTKEMVLSVLDGKVGTPAELASWLDAQTAGGSLPVRISKEEPDAD